jgi:polyphosphate kinase 2 (PPK2 family)
MPWPALLPSFPAAGEVVIFDRSWYNARASSGLGFCTDEEAKSFLAEVPHIEADGRLRIILWYWLEVSPEEQTRRLEGRFGDGQDLEALPMDLKPQSVVRLPRGRRDVRGDRHALSALVRRQIG